jgi:hypothetical protein
MNSARSHSNSSNGKDDFKGSNLSTSSLSNKQRFQLKCSSYLQEKFYKVTLQKEEINTKKSIKVSKISKNGKTQVEVANVK